MRIRYQIIKKRNKHFEIYEFDTIEECERKIEEIQDWEMYSDVTLSIKDVYYTD